MWKNALLVVLLGVLAFLWSDLMQLFDRIAMRDVATVLLIVGTVGAVGFIRHVVRRL
jgi:multisubunit Na+/H+ antiporter MnhF subunit